MTLQIINPALVTTIVSTWAIYGGDRPTDPNWITRMFDQANAEPTFDAQHETFTNPIVDTASQNAIGDNSNSIVPFLTVEPTLIFSYTNGYSETHEQSKGFSITATQEFDFKFAGAGEGSTLSATGSFNWTDSTGSDTEKTFSSSIAAPFEVPAGKIFEERLLFNQETVTVPYTWPIEIIGSYPINSVDQDENQVYRSIGEAFYYTISSVPRPPFPVLDGVDWNDVSVVTNQFGLDTDIIYAPRGTLKVTNASATTVKIYDITHQNPNAEPSETPAALHVSDGLAAPDGFASLQDGVAATVLAVYDPAVPIGVHYTFADDGWGFRDTPFDDYVDGGAGGDHIVLTGGEDIAYAMGGNDTISGTGVGRSLLDGGDGDDVISLASTAPFSTVLGGAGNDRISIDAPAAMIYGGAGDDLYQIAIAHAGGTVITDLEGHNRLEMSAGCIPVTFERVVGSGNLYILVEGDTYDRGRDVVWVDFFADPDNEVNGMTTEQVAEIAAIYRPEAAAVSADQVFPA